MKFFDENATKEEIDRLEKQAITINDRIAVLKGKLASARGDVSPRNPQVGMMGVKAITPKDIVLKMHFLTGLNWTYDNDTNNIKCSLIGRENDIPKLLNEFQIPNQSLPKLDASIDTKKESVTINLDKAEDWAKAVKKGLAEGKNTLLEEIKKLSEKPQQQKAFKKGH